MSIEVLSSVGWSCNLALLLFAEEIVVTLFFEPVFVCLLSWILLPAVVLWILLGRNAFNLETAFSWSYWASLNLFSLLFLEFIYFFRLLGVL